MKSTYLPFINVVDKYFSTRHTSLLLCFATSFNKIKNCQIDQHTKVRVYYVHIKEKLRKINQRLLIMLWNNLDNRLSCYIKPGSVCGLNRPPNHQPTLPTQPRVGLEPRVHTSQRTPQTLAVLPPPLTISLIFSVLQFRIKVFENQILYAN